MEQKNDFTNLFFRYMMIIIPPFIIVAILTVGICFNRIAEETKKLNMGIVEQSSRILDSRMKEIYDVGMRVEGNSVISDMVSHREYSRGYRLSQILSELGKEKQGNLLRSVGIYLPEEDIYIGTDSNYTFSEYYRRNLRASGYDEAWWNQQAAEDAVCFVSGTAKNNMDGTDEVLIYSKKLFLRSGDDVIFFALAYQNTILNDLSVIGVEEDKGVAIVSRDGQVLLKTPNFNAVVLPEQILGAYGNLKAEGAALFYKSSEVLRLKYINSFAGESLTGGAFHLALLFCLLLGIGLLVSALLAKLHTGRLQHSYMELMDKNRTLSENIRQQIDGLEKRTILNLLYHVNQEEDCKILEQYHKKIPETGFFVAVLMPIQPDADSEEIRKSAEAFVTGSLEKTDCYHYAVKLGETYVLLLGCERNQSAAPEVFRAWSRELVKYTKEQLCMGIGKFAESKEQIWNSYDTAYLAAKYAQKEMLAEGVWYEDISQTLNGEIYYTSAMEMVLKQNVRMGAEAKVREVLAEIYRHNFRERLLKQSDLKRLLVNIITGIYDVIDSLFKDDGENHEKYERICQNILQNNRPEEAFQILEEVCIALCSKAEPSDSKVLYKKKIVEYIEENYQNCALSLDHLAEYMNINYYYLSRLFKELMGETFMSYLLSVRMKHAKKLLELPNAMVKEVAVQVGFVDSQALIRAYKKYYNTTPGKDLGKKE